LGYHAQHNFVVLVKVAFLLVDGLKGSYSLALFVVHWHNQQALSLVPSLFIDFLIETFITVSIRDINFDVVCDSVPNDSSIYRYLYHRQWLGTLRPEYSFSFIEDKDGKLIIVFFCTLSQRKYWQDKSIMAWYVSSKLVCLIISVVIDTRRLSRQPIPMKCFKSVIRYYTLSPISLCCRGLSRSIRDMNDFSSPSSYERKVSLSSTADLSLSSMSKNENRPRSSLKKDDRNYAP
jgi:hypothetical protein